MKRCKLTGRSVLSGATILFMFMATYRLPSAGWETRTNLVQSPVYLTDGNLFHSDRLISVAGDFYTNQSDNSPSGSQPGFIRESTGDNNPAEYPKLNSLDGAILKRIGFNRAAGEADLLSAWDGESNPFSETDGISRNQVRQELDQFERAFSETVGNLFSDSSGKGSADLNPFETALKSEPDSSKPPQNSSDSSVNKKDGNDLADTGEQVSEPGTTDNPPSISEDSGTEIYYPYLYVGEINGQKSAHRAFLENAWHFRLENGYSIRNPLSGLVGMGTHVKIVPVNQQIMTSDWNGDLVPELFLADLRPMGSVLWIQTLFGGPFQFLESSILYSHIESMASFNVDSDPENEIIFVFRGKTSLAVYDVSSNGLAFQRELGLPFDAATVFETKDGLGNSYLHALDQSLNRSLTLISGGLGTYFMGNPPTLQSSEWVQIDSSSGYTSGPSFLSLFYEDRIAVVRIQGSHLAVVGSFSTYPKPPEILIGDFYQDGNLYTLLVP